MRIASCDNIDPEDDGRPPCRAVRVVLDGTGQTWFGHDHKPRNDPHQPARPGELRKEIE
ncbi:hypothetical protein ACFPN7_26790 [Amycolatopsis halotolerans]|uniref:hypothetical protein n=1 Tax=Amycolatopsis halotolerans TaxID=330083 RepID=UPI00362293FD